MKLTKLVISQVECWHDENQGKYTATVSYEGERGSTTLTLDPEVSLALLAVIGPTITKFSHRVALQLEESINQAVLEAKKMPEIPVETTPES